MTDLNGPTYASASTFTVAGDQTSVYTVGARIKLTQTTVKYFVVTASSFGGGNTTVTVTGGTDYSLANAAITSPFYSYVAAPQGFPGWFNFAPAFTGISSDTSTARFTVVGRVCTVHMGLAGTSTATTKTFTMPVAVAAGDPCLFYPAKVKDNGVVATALGLIVATAGSAAAAAYRDMAQLAWTASGACYAIASFSYQV